MMTTTKNAYPKVTLIVFLTAVTAIAASMGWAPSVIQPLKAPPTRVLRSALEKLSEDARAVNFLRIEEAFANFRDDTDGDSTHGPALLQALHAATADLPELSSETMARLQFPIRRQLPGARGEDMAARFESFYEYSRIEAREMASTPATDDVDVELDFLNNKVALRQKYFGNAEANWLFAEEHALAYYILALRKLDGDPTLTDAERERRRNDLQARYENRRLSRFGGD